MKVRKLDFVIYIFIIASTIWLLTSFGIRQGEIEVYLSFVLVGIISFIEAVHTSSNINIKRTVNIFSYIFFFIAPWQQYTENVSLWSGNGLSLKYDDSLYLKANLIIIVSLGLFNGVYNYCHKKDITMLEQREEVVQYVVSKQSKFILTAISTISFLILGVTGNLMGNGLTIGDSSINSQLWNMIRFFPVCAIVLYAMAYGDMRHMMKYKSFDFILIIFLIIYFPFWGNMARFLLLGTYVVILALLFKNNKNKSLYFLLFYVGFIVGFSSIRRATSISALMNVSINFCHVDFDAHQILMTLIKYTDEQGMVFGKNIISALAFIIPRSIWSGKMLNSGGIAASYYGSWFTNVSSPFFGELYFSLKWLGVVVGSIVLAFVALKIDSWDESLNLMKRGTFCIAVGMTIYICRGSLIASMAFTLGLILALFIISKVAKVEKIEKDEENI